jgi:hypothetical protein
MAGGESRDGERDKREEEVKKLEEALGPTNERARKFLGAEGTRKELEGGQRKSDQWEGLRRRSGTKNWKGSGGLERADRERREAPADRTRATVLVMGCRRGLRRGEIGTSTGGVAGREADGGSSDGGKAVPC